MSAQAELSWLARHEGRLAWRDALVMLQGGRRRGKRWALSAMVIISTLLHLIAYAVVAPAAEALTHLDKTSLLVATAAMLMAWALMLSQAMESATRSFYARSDLDLILSSPTPGRQIFVIRICAILLTSVGMAALTLGPFINVAALVLGPRFLCAYGVLFAMGCLATALAVGMTALLFRLAGPARTRLLSQIMAAIVGAGFVIGVQTIAILSYGSLSSMRVFTSAQWVAAAPDLDSPFWWPVRAGTGDVVALLSSLGVALSIFIVSTLSLANEFARSAHKVAGVVRGSATKMKVSSRFRLRAQSRALRWKEWTLLLRDPWLLSQTLMQVLYLLPPALMLWLDFGAGSGALVLVPVIVMAAGQLAGGLAWLAISAEDAPDLIATAPIPAAAVLRAKIEAVMIAVMIPVSPLVLAMLATSLVASISTIVGVTFAAAAACAVQFFFKGQAKRSNFRRRQTSSRIATLAEAMASISIAAAAALAAGGLWVALVPAAIAGGIVLGVRTLTRA